MRIDFSTDLFRIIESLTGPQSPYDITPQHQAAIDAMPSVEWNPQSISASQIVLTRPNNYSLTISGSGINPSNSFEALMNAIDNGIAQGQFSSFVLRQGGTELARLGITSSGWTLSSGSLQLSLTGTVPTSLQQLLAIFEAEGNFLNNPNALYNLMNNYAATGLTLRDGSTVLAGLSIAAGAVTLQVPGMTAVMTGTFPTLFGNLLRQINDAQDAAGQFGNWFETLLLDEFQVGSLVARNASNQIVLRVSEAGNDFERDNVFLLDTSAWLPSRIVSENFEALVSGEMVLAAGNNNSELIDRGAATTPVLVNAGGGNDTVIGGSGDDVIHADRGNNLIQPRAGNDTIFGGTGNDTIWAGPGDDLIDLYDNGGANEVWAGPGNDTIFGGNGAETLGGGAGDDLILNRGGASQLWGGAGDDTIYTGPDNALAGGGAGDDIVYGGSGNNTLMGGLGNDTLYGQSGGNILYLGMGNDFGYGGAGNDTIFAGPGFDRIWGGAGADRFEFWRGYGWNRIEDFSAAEGDMIGLGRGMWSAQGNLTAAQVVSTFGRVNPAGDVVLEFAAAGTSVVIVGLGTLDSLADSILIL